MLDLLLSVQMTLTILTDQLLTMGLPLIDKSLDKLMVAMKNPPTAGLNWLLLDWSRTIAACLALGVGAYEAWMMMLARRGMDVMKMLRIVIIGFCISSPGMSAIKSLVDEPGTILETYTKKQAFNKNNELDMMQKAVAKEQSHYIDSLRSLQGKLKEQKEAQDAQEEAEASKEGGVSGWVKGKIAAISNSIDNIGTEINNMAKRSAALVETKLAEFANDIIRFIGEVIFQMTYYGMLLGQRIFLNVLWLFMPIAFAMSLAPPFRSAWSQWLSKYLTLSLWPFLIYLVLYYVDYLLIYYLKNDLEAYKGLLGNQNMNTWDGIGALGIQAIGTTCSYVIGLLAGAKILSLVPEVASWLIPGGVSSGAGSMTAGTVGAAVGYTAGKVGSAGSTAGSTATSVTTGAVSGGFSGAKEGAKAGAYMPGGAVAKTTMATVGMIGGGTVGAAGGAIKGAFQKSDNDPQGGKRG